MTAISTEAKVGLFVLVALLILGYMSFKVGKQDFGLRKGYAVDIVFENVAGLDKDAVVVIAGVQVGKVEEIFLKDGKATVRIRLPLQVKLGKDTAAAIKTRGVLGEKYIELTPGVSKEYLRDQEQITYTEKQADIDRLLNQLALIADDIKMVTGSLSKVLAGKEAEQSLGDILENTRKLTGNLNMVVKGNEAALQTVLENTRQLTGNLNRMVVNNDEKIAQVLDGLKNASRELEKSFSSLGEIAEGVKKGEGTLGQLLKDKTTVDRLNRAMASLQEITERINQGKGTLGRLIADEETVNVLNESLAGISRYVSKAEQFRTHLSYRGEFLFDKSDAKNYLEVRIQPKEDKFYILGVVSDPRGRRTVRESITGGVTTRTEEWDKQGLLFTAQIGKRFRDVALRGGLFESTGGLGIDYFTLNDKLKLTLEAFDFTAGRRAHVKAYAEYRLFKHLYLTAGWDDPFNRESSSPFAGMAIRFEDDDLKYLLTSTPIPK